MLKKVKIQEGSDDFNELYYNVITIQFERFLKKRVKSLKSVNQYMKATNQYIGWFKSKNIKGSLVADKKKFYEYKFYLKEAKKYKDSTVKQKMGVLVRLKNFLINFDLGSCCEKISDSEVYLYNKNKKNKCQYNYLTNSFVKF